METTEDEIRRRARAEAIVANIPAPIVAPIGSTEDEVRAAARETFASALPNDKARDYAKAETVLSPILPTVTEVPTSDPVAPATTSTPDPATAPATPPVPPPPALTKDGLQASGRSTETTRTVVDKDMRAAEAEVDTASKALLATQELERKAEATDAANRLKQAEIDAKNLDIEQKKKDDEAKRDAARLKQAQAEREKIVEEVKNSENELKTAAAADKRTYFQTQGTGQKVLWGLALVFGAGERNGNGENPGLQMLDKTMKDWDDVRTKNLEKLEKKAATDKGLLAKFWTDYGEQAKAQKELEDAAGYLSVAEDIRKNTEARKGMMSANAVAANERKAAEFEARAAEKSLGVVEKKQAIAEGRAGKSRSVQSFDRPKPADGTGGPNMEKFVPDGKGGFIEVVDKGTAEKLRARAGDLPEIEKRGQDVIAQIGKTPSSWWKPGDALPSGGQPRRELDGMLESLAESLAKGSGDASPAKVKAIKARFEPNMWTNRKEAADDVQRVIEEERSGYISQVNAAALRSEQPRAPAATAAAPASAPKEGDTRTLASGRAVVFSGGKWAAR